MTPPFQIPRMLVWALLSLVLMLASLFAQDVWPGSLLAVSIYKFHLLALAGWGGYWLDRALFPYDRPHTHLLPAVPEPQDEAFRADYLEVSSTSYPMTMVRRAVIVAGCLVCVGLGA